MQMLEDLFTKSPDERRNHEKNNVHGSVQKRKLRFDAHEHELSDRIANQEK